MTESLRALASVASVEEEQRARQHAEALRAEERARTVLSDAIERVGEAEGASREASRDQGATAAERTMNDARRARLRERVRAAGLIQTSAETALERARMEVDRTLAGLGTAHGERRAVEGALDRAAIQARAVRSRKEDDEEGEQARRRVP